MSGDAVHTHINHISIKLKAERGAMSAREERNKTHKLALKGEPSEKEQSFSSDHLRLIQACQRVCKIIDQAPRFATDRA